MKLMSWIKEKIKQLKDSRVLKFGGIAFILFVCFSVYNYIMDDFKINNIYEEAKSFFSFIMLGWVTLMWFYRNEKIEITLTEGKFKNKNESFKVKRKQLSNISDLTNLVSAKYYGGGQVEGAVRNQLFMYQGLISEDELRRLNS